MVLLVLLLVQFALRLHGQSIAAAIGSTIFVGGFMLLARKFGAWSSPTGAWNWLRSHRRVLLLIAAGTTDVVVVMLYAGHYSFYEIVVETLGGYFVFHAVSATCLSAYKSVVGVVK